MTVQRTQVSKMYVQDEHQRALIALSNAIDTIQLQIIALQTAVATLKKKAGIN